MFWKSSTGWIPRREECRVACLQARTCLPSAGNDPLSAGQAQAIDQSGATGGAGGCMCFSVPWAKGKQVVKWARKERKGT